MVIVEPVAEVEIPPPPDIVTALELAVADPLPVLTVVTPEPTKETVEPVAVVVMSPVPCMVIVLDDVVAEPLSASNVVAPDPLPAAMLIPPAEFVTVILLPAVIVAKTGVVPVEPIGI